MSKLEQLKEIKGLIASLVGLITVLIVIGGALMEWRVGVKVGQALAAEDLATDEKIIDMDKVAALNTSGVADNKDDITINRKNVERAFAALMGRAVPEPDDD